MKKTATRILAAFLSLLICCSVINVPTKAVTYHVTRAAAGCYYHLDDYTLMQGTTDATTVMNTVLPIANSQYSNMSAIKYIVYGSNNAGTLYNSLERTTSGWKINTSLSPNKVAQNAGTDAILILGVKKTAITTYKCTSDINTVLVYGNPTKSPTFTTNSGYYGQLNGLGSFGWKKKDSGGNLSDFTGTTFNEGRYCIYTQLRTDKDDEHYIAEGCKVYIDGVYVGVTRAPALGTDSFGKDFSYAWITTDVVKTLTTQVQHSISVTGGTAKVNKTVTTRAYKDQIVTLTAENPAPGAQTFDKWVATSGTVTFADAYSSTTTFTMPDYNVVIEARWKPLEYKITVSGGTANYSNAPKGKQVTVTATVPAGKVFTYWSATPSSVVFDSTTSTTAHFTMPQSNVTVTAHFADATKYNLSLTDCTAKVNGSSVTSAAQGVTVTVTHNNAPTGQIFDRWVVTGFNLASSTVDSFTFTMPANNVSIQAVYKDKYYTVYISNGTASSTSAKEGTTINISAATAPAGKVFDRWSYSGAVPNDIYSPNTSFTMPANNVSLTATYKDKPAATYSVSVTNGTASAYSAKEGTTVTITAATAPSGQVFDRWQINSGNPSLYNIYSSSTTFTMPANDVSVTAVYRSIPLYTITLTGGKAYVNGSQVTSAEAGDSVKIVADPAPAGKVFDRWKTLGVGMMSWLQGTKATDQTIVIYMPAQNITVTAQYVDAPTYSITVNGGTASDSAAYEGKKVTLTAGEAPAGKLFDHWSVSGATVANASAATTTFTMPANAVTATVIYKEAPTYTITVNNGTASDAKAYKGKKITITAAAAPEGKIFDKWEITGATLADPYASSTTFTMPDKNVTVTAKYKDKPAETYSVTVVNGTADKNAATKGTKITITANEAPEGKVFDHWDVSGVTVADKNAAKTSFTMPDKNVTVTAVYKEAPTYTITVNNGTASDTSAYKGKKITVTADTAPEGKVFDCWNAEGVTLSDSKATAVTFTMPDKAVTLTAVYKDAPKEESKEDSKEESKEDSTEESAEESAIEESKEEESKAEESQAEESKTEESGNKTEPTKPDTSDFLQTLYNYRFLIIAGAIILLLILLLILILVLVRRKEKKEDEELEQAEAENK